MSFQGVDSYENGDLIEGSPYELSQHISRIIASGAHFQYVDGNVIEVLRPGKEEVIVFANGTVLELQPVPEYISSEKVNVEPEPEPILELQPEVVVEVEPEVASKPRGRKPKAVVEDESTVEAEVEE